MHFYSLELFFLKDISQQQISQNEKKIIEDFPVWNSEEPMLILFRKIGLCERSIWLGVASPSSESSCIYFSISWACIIFSVLLTGGCGKFWLSFFLLPDTRLVGVPQVQNFYQPILENFCFSMSQLD